MNTVLVHLFVWACYCCLKYPRQDNFKRNEVYVLYSFGDQGHGASMVQLR